MARRCGAEATRCGVVLIVQPEVLGWKCWAGSAGLEVLGAMVHGLGVMLANHLIPRMTSEPGALQPFLESLLLEGRVITLDAAHTSQATEQAIVQKGGTTSCG